MQRTKASAKIGNDSRIITGLAILPPFLLMKSLIGTVILTSLAVILAITHGRKFKPIPNTLIFISVAFANVLQSNGLILFSIFGFPITMGSLIIGAQKAFTLIGLVYISQFMVSGKPELPGRAGRLISLQFLYFEKITRVWQDTGKIAKGFIHRIDTLLCMLDTVENTNSVQQGVQKKNSEAGITLTSQTVQSLKWKQSIYLLPVLFSWGLYLGAALGCIVFPW